MEVTRASVEIMTVAVKYSVILPLNFNWLQFSSIKIVKVNLVDEARNTVMNQNRC